MKPSIRYLCPFALRTGYARAAHDYCAALVKAGANLDILPVIDADSENLEPRYQNLVQYVNRGEDTTHLIVHLPPLFAHDYVDESIAPSKAKKICITTRETNKFPKEAAEVLNKAFDLVIVPSTYNKFIFVESGVRKVEVLPYTFDPYFWYRENPKKKSSKVFTFYSIGLWGVRKNFEGLLKAYYTEFRNEKDVVLKLVCPDVPEQELAQLKIDVKLVENRNLPKVVVIRDRLSENALLEIHERSHCYVTLTRSEGFGLGAFEAMLLGNQVIHTNFSGLTDFLYEHGSNWSVNYFLTPVVTPEPKNTIPLSIGHIQIPASEYVPSVKDSSADQLFAEPDLYEARQKMRLLYEEWRANKNLVKPEYFVNKHPRSYFEQTYGYDTIGKKLLSLVEGI